MSRAEEIVKQLEEMLKEMPENDKEIIPLVIKLDNCLIDMYERRYDSAQSPTIRALFKDGTHFLRSKAPNTR